MSPSDMIIFNRTADRLTKAKYKASKQTYLNAIVRDHLDDCVPKELKQAIFKYLLILIYDWHGINYPIDRYQLRWQPKLDPDRQKLVNVLPYHYHIKPHVILESDLDFLADFEKILMASKNQQEQYVFKFILKWTNRI